MGPSRFRGCLLEAKRRLCKFSAAQLLGVLEGTVDTGCSKLIVGDHTIALHDYALRRLFVLSIRYVPSIGRSFHFANGQAARSNWFAEHPVGLGGRSGVFKFC
eukprot:2369348-Pyramimonas_sp.AAC.1